MRVAQVSPLYESVPPKSYGGTERVVSYLTEELVRLGHDVTLFASGDSVTAAELVSVCPRALRACQACLDPMPWHYLLLEKLYRRFSDFDLIHFHVDYLHFPITRRVHPANLTTLHGRLDIPDLAPLYFEYREMPVVSISSSQRLPLPQANWQTTVYHGLPPDLYSLHEHPAGYLAFLGRVSPEKRVEWAIEIARRADMEIRVAAKVDPADRRYFETEIKPLLGLPHVTYLGEIAAEEMAGFLGNARALLFPIDWPEPFGLVQIEAMACGTPVIALRRGSVPEVIDDGVTGFVCDNLDEAVAAVRRLPELSRRRCREVFERRFSASRMASDYIRLYERIISQHGNGHG